MFVVEFKFNEFAIDTHSAPRPGCVGVFEFLFFCGVTALRMTVLSLFSCTVKLFSFFPFPSCLFFARKGENLCVSASGLSAFFRLFFSSLSLFFLTSFLQVLFLLASAQPRILPTRVVFQGSIVEGGPDRSGQFVTAGGVNDPAAVVWSKGCLVF